MLRNTSIKEINYISSDEQKKLLLDLLCDLDSFCRKNNINYYLTGGTLLGAIRHRGFIPWDDDVDVCLMRTDYERLIDIYSSSCSNFVLLSMKSDSKYCFPYAKLVNDSTVLLEEGQKKSQMGVCLDIFPIDNCPGKTWKEACKCVDKMSIYRWIRNFKMISINRNRNLIKNSILLLGKFIFLPISKRNISKLIEKKASRNRNVKCSFVGALTNTAYGHGEVYEKCHFAEGIEVEFEGKIFIAPKDYDFILKSMYKDYLQLPPLEKRKSSHNSICWYKNDISN